MTVGIDGHSAPAGDRLTFAVDCDRRLLVIECRGGIRDHDLLTVIPRIWEEHPDVIGCNTIVDTRTLTSEGGWTWQALREIARLWRQFADGRDRGRRTAIVATDTWITLLAGAVAIDYRGREFRCFGDPDAARAWAIRT